MGKRRESLSGCQRAMNKAALEGDWLAAEKLLEQDPTLACDEITERGDRALHVAVAIKNMKFVQKLVERMCSSDLVMLDGRGYTACCYAAISGAVNIVDVMMKKNPNLGAARDKNDITPIHKAALHGNEETVSYFLNSIKVEDLSKGEWFDLMLVAIRSEMYDVASEILDKNGCIATITNKEGTALHHLARQNTLGISYVSGLAERIWAEIQRLEQASVLELMKNPPILHDAAKVGNVELITMLTRTYPDLIWDTDSNGIQSVYPPALQMRREIVWFTEVRSTVPRSCREMRNKDGQTPRELFYKEHKSLLEKSETWMKNTADSCTVVAIMMLIMALAAAFIVQGGKNQDTGSPTYLKGNWFACSVISEALALLGSTYSMLMFWTIKTWSTWDFEEDEFLHDLLYILKWGLAALLVATISTITAFISAYFLVFGQERTALITCVILLVYILLFYLTYLQFSAFFLSMTFVEYFFWFRPDRQTHFRPSRQTLFRRVENNKAQV